VRFGGGFAFYAGLPGFANIPKWIRYGAIGVVSFGLQVYWDIQVNGYSPTQALIQNILGEIAGIFASTVVGQLFRNVNVRSGRDVEATPHQRVIEDVDVAPQQRVIEDVYQIDIFAYRGTGFKDPKYSNEHGLIQAGHIGVSTDGGNTIYGFHPSPEAIRQLEEEGVNVMEFLKSGGALRGQLQDDTAIFIRANELAQLGAPTQVYRLPQTVSQNHFQAVEAEIQNQIQNGSPYPSWYAFPFRDESGNNRTMPIQCNNCATWPRTLGLWTHPSQTGQLRVYMNDMKDAGATEWHP